MCATSTCVHMYGSSDPSTKYPTTGSTHLYYLNLMKLYDFMTLWGVHVCTHVPVLHVCGGTYRYRLRYMYVLYSICMKCSTVPEPV